MKKPPTYRIKHIGVNTPDDAHAQELADTLSYIFCQAREGESPVSIFSGSIFEIMKHDRRGLHGHIALQTEDVAAAMSDLAKKGITFQEDTIRRNEDGAVTFVYLHQTFGGFAVHLTI